MASIEPCSSALVTGPDDEIVLVGAVDRRRRRGDVERHVVYAVVHRSLAVWTHVYRVAPGAVPGCRDVFLEKVYPGDRAAEAAAWARDRLGATG